ncbi:MAG: glycosyltransferase family 2 protein, partial [Desulfovibrionaceae bacterium]|nr:glycosyltransferase family 2 protein [Desulfovibrionaceae bacterium]
MRVSVIIPAWNLWEMTADCLRSLAEHSAGEDMDVLVVDNGSTDATCTELEPLGHALFGTGFRAVRLPENQGFARACNAGAAVAQGELLFFLNNDTTCTPGWLPPLRAAFDDARLGAVGPLLFYPDGTVQHCGICFSPFCQVGHLYAHLPATFAAAHRPHPLQAITGAALMLRKGVFEDCGGFFEGYRNGFEDIDLCCAISARGLKLRVEARSRIVHHTSQTPGRFEHEQDNSRLLGQRYGNVLRPDEHLLAALDGYSLQLGRNLGTWLVLSDAEQQKRNAALSGAEFCPETCRNMLEEEPLWRDGWFLLAGYLEQQGRIREALELLQRCWWLFPEERTFVVMLRLCARLQLRNDTLEG